MQSLPISESSSEAFSLLIRAGSIPSLNAEQPPSSFDRIILAVTVPVIQEGHEVGQLKLVRVKNLA